MSLKKVLMLYDTLFVVLQSNHLEINGQKLDFYCILKYVKRNEWTFYFVLPGEPKKFPFRNFIP